MSDIQLDDNGDIYELNGDLVLTAGIERIRQHISQKLKTWLGEWFLDIRIGIPYKQQVFIKSPDPVILDSIFKKIIIETPGVLELQEFDLDINTTTREFTLSFKAKTTEGIIDYSEVLP